MFLFSVHKPYKLSVICFHSVSLSALHFRPDWQGQHRLNLFASKVETNFLFQCGEPGFHLEPYNNNHRVYIIPLQKSFSSMPDFIFSVLLTLFSPVPRNLIVFAMKNFTLSKAVINDHWLTVCNFSMVFCFSQWKWKWNFFSDRCYRYFPFFLGCRKRGEINSPSLSAHLSITPFCMSSVRKAFKTISSCLSSVDCLAGWSWKGTEIKSLW